MSTPNAELAYRTLDHIDANPKSWDQTTWYCRSAACFAGHALMLAGAAIGYDEAGHAVVIAGPESLAGVCVSNAGPMVLGLGDADGEYAEIDGEDRWLFSPNNGREDLGRIVEKIFGPRPTVVDHGPVQPPYGTPERVGVPQPTIVDIAPINEWDASTDMPAPCQPIGCDNGYHLPGCTYAEVDYGTGCRCGWLGVGTPEHAPTSFCISPAGDPQ